MTHSSQYPLLHHPCFSSVRKNLWIRIHLPVAKRCNVKCVFCDQNNGAACHTAKPGYASKVISPTEAIAKLKIEMKQNPDLKIIAISGPGEPLANEETFAVLEKIRLMKTKCELCLSTNGVLLPEKVHQLKSVGVRTISVSISAINPDTIAKVYEWALIDGLVLKGIVMAERIVSKQLRGIELATELGISVKVNTVLMAGINLDEIAQLSKQIADSGAILQNIVPLVVCTDNPNLVPPTNDEISIARKIGSKNIPQFIHCKQCRSDVVGIPGFDRIF